MLIGMGLKMLRHSRAVSISWWATVVKGSEDLAGSQRSLREDRARYALVSGIGSTDSVPPWPIDICPTWVFVSCFRGECPRGTLLNPLGDRTVSVCETLLVAVDGAGGC